MTQSAVSLRTLGLGLGRFMPILLHVDDLRPGLCLAQAIYQGDQRLLCGGQQLESWHIDALRRRMPNQLVRVLDPILDKIVDFQDDSHNENVSATVTVRMSRMMSTVQAKIGNRIALNGSDLTGIQHALEQVIQHLTDHPVTAAVLRHGEGKTGYLQKHAANVMYLSLLVGNAVRDYVYHERARSTHTRTLSVSYGINLTPLALGCLFHDLGMVELEDLIYKAGPLTLDEVDRLRHHPLAGSRMLPEETDAVARMIVRTHHENMNGTGYPLGTPGDRLHIFSRIVRIADAFDAATSDRVYRSAKSAARVLWEITAGPTRCYYDPLITRILSGLVQPFPIGAKIRLDSGQWAVVVRHNRKSPFRPTVIAAFDEQGHRIKLKHLSPLIDLAEAEDVRLVEFDGEDLSFLNIAAPQLPPPDPGQVVEGLSADSALAPADRRDLFSFVYP
jgi:HD-GYP domain-containing protein (c-di-GMP phosphodiesterase class II)